MKQPENADAITIVTKDPLSEPTRRMRRALSMTSLLVFAIAAGARPLDMEISGLRFASGTIDILIMFVKLSLVYFLLSFSVYAYHDYVLWRSEVGWKLRALTSNGVSSPHEAVELALDEILDEHRFRFRLRASEEEIRKTAALFALDKIGLLKVLWRMSGTLSVRLFIDFYFPVLLGLIALGCILTAPTVNAFRHAVQYFQC